MRERAREGYQYAVTPEQRGPARGARAPPLCGSAELGLGAPGHALPYSSPKIFGRPLISHQRFFCGS